MKPQVSGVYFPIETTSRELSGYLLTATALASNGISSILGHKVRVTSALHRASQLGVVFYKTMEPYYGDKRHYSVAQDPEGISYSAYADFFSVRPPGSPNPMSPIYFSYGPDDYEFLRNRYSNSGGIIPSGSSRVDLWHTVSRGFYADETRAIQACYGNNIVLFASSGLVPHEKYGPKGDSRRRNFRLHPFVEAVRYVAHNLDSAIVVRPHPSESWHAWKAVTKEMPNVFVESAFDLSAWVASATAVIHPGQSTAAIESVMGDRPAISLQLQHGGTVGVPRLLSYRTSSPQGVLELVDTARRGLVGSLPDVSAAGVLKKKFFEWGAATRKANALAERFDFVGLERNSFRGFLRRERGPHWNPSAELNVSSEPQFKKSALSLEMIEKKVELAANLLSTARIPNVRRVDVNCYRILPS